MAPIVPTKGHKYLLNLSLKDAKFSFSNTDSRLIESDTCDDEEEKGDVTVEKLTSFKLKMEPNLKKMAITEVRRKESFDEKPQSATSTNVESNMSVPAQQQS